jgi:hypothetical protein
MRFFGLCFVSANVWTRIKKIKIRQAGFKGTLTLTWPRIKKAYVQPVHPMCVILGGHESRWAGFIGTLAWNFKKFMFTQYSQRFTMQFTQSMFTQCSRQFTRQFTQFMLTQCTRRLTMHFTQCMFTQSSR